MRVGVEKAVHENLPQDEVGAAAGDYFAVEAGVLEFLAVGRLDAVDVFHRQDSAGAEFRYRLRDVDRRVGGEVAGESLLVAKLVGQVGLFCHRLGEFLHHQQRVDGFLRRHLRFYQAGEFLEHLALDADFLDDPRPADLDRHYPSVERNRAVHLSDAAGGDRLRVELRIEFLQRPAEFLLHFGFYFLEAHRRHTVLEKFEFGDVFRRGKVRARAEQLAELDERRA